VRGDEDFSKLRMKVIKQRLDELGGHCHGCTSKRDYIKALKDIIAHPDSVGSGLLGLTASVPTFNGNTNYVRKLVLTGEKVGIVALNMNTSRDTFKLRKI